MRINTRTKVEKTENYEGGEVFNLSPKAKLLHLTSTCLFREPKFYGTISDHEKDIKETATKVANKDPKFLLQLASYLRNEQYMRSISTYLLALSANTIDTKQYIHEYTSKIVKRADEINEVLAMQLELFGKPIPNSLKKGIGDTFKNFDRYNFKKYDRKGKVTFKDAIMLTHPKKPSDIIKEILDEKLPEIKTWETIISKKGSTKEAWEEVIDTWIPSDTIVKNYFAIIRNLRNVLEAEVSKEHIDKIINAVKNLKAIKNSKMFPFRFLSAHKQLENVSSPYTSKVLDAVEEALEISFENIPHLPGTTFIASDVSGSMSWTPISKHSSIIPAEIGLVLSAGLQKFTDHSLFGLFAENWKLVQLGTKSGILSNVKYLSGIDVGGSTNGWKAVAYLNKNNINVDRIFIFTDCQLYDSNGWGFHDEDADRTIRKELNKYKQNINPNVKTYIFDLTGYGKVNFPESDRSVAEITGWSDKTFKFVELFEKDPNAQIKYIERNY